MVIDELNNIDKYDFIPNEVVKFLNNLPENCGKYQINPNIYANIEEYNTKPEQDCFFETHKKYADIQIILKGKERLDYTSCENLSVKEPYNSEKDIAFWDLQIHNLASVYLDGSNFVYIPPNEPHRPQMNYADKSQFVRKIVFKIRIFQEF